MHKLHVIWHMEGSRCMQNTCVTMQAICMFLKIGLPTETVHVNKHIYMALILEFSG